MIPAFSGVPAGPGPVWLMYVDCVGYETSVAQCRHNGWGQTYCYHYADVWISCHDENITGYAYASRF